MNKIILIVIVLCAFGLLAISAAYLADNPQSLSDSSDKVTLNVSSEGPNELSNFIADVENKSYYEGYDRETLNWMKSLGDKSVFYSLEYIVIMDSRDAGNLRSEYATDVQIDEFFECRILENHSLGDVPYSKDILFVRDVDYLYENITYFNV